MDNQGPNTNERNKIYKNNLSKTVRKTIEFRHHTKLDKIWCHSKSIKIKKGITPASTFAIKFFSMTD